MLSKTEEQHPIDVCRDQCIVAIWIYVLGACMIILATANFWLPKDEILLRHFRPESCCGEIRIVSIDRNLFDLSVVVMEKDSHRVTYWIDSNIFLVYKMYSKFGVEYPYYDEY